MSESVSLVIPVYNEKTGIAPMLKRLLAVAPQLGPEGEIIVVEDGSTDGARELLKQLATDFPPNFRLVLHDRNRGYGRALKTGVKAARNEMIAIADADGTYPMERIGEFAEAMRTEGAAMVVGARPVSQQPAVRRPAKAVLKVFAEYLTGQRIPDLNSGFRIFRRADVARHQNLLPDGFSFTTTITMALLTEGERVVFIPIRYRKRIGNSKIRPIRDTANFLMLTCRTALAFNPLKVFGPAGLALIAAGCGFLAARFILNKQFGVATTVTLLVGGVQVLAMGLLADLINRRGR
ncbi:glycosyltransferase family 2 protein [soil metagenome]